MLVVHHQCARKTGAQIPVTVLQYRTHGRDDTAAACQRLGIRLVLVVSTGWTFHSQAPGPPSMQG